MLKMNEIYNMDCLEGLRLLDDECIDLVVTSPPYDNIRDYNGYSFDFENIAKELFRVMKTGGVVVWVVSDQTVNGSETGTSFRQALYFKEVGFNLHDTMIWKKDSFSFPEGNRYPQNFEYMFILSKNKPKQFMPIKDRKNKYKNTSVHGTYRTKDGKTVDRSISHKDKTIGDIGVRFNVWEIASEKNNLYNHPAPYPEQLAEDHIISWSNKNDVVLDIFMGSGTTAKMALVNDRQFIGFEISKEYCDIANKRIDYYKRQGKLDL